MAVFIVSGASSLLGIDMCDYIANFKENIVFALTRENSEGVKKIPKHKNIKIIFVDLKNISLIKYEIKKADVYINFAWTNTDHHGRENFELQMANVSHFLNCIQIAKELGCKLFVEAGSQAEYGIVKDMIYETTPCFPETPYGIAKLKVKERGFELCKELDIKYLHLRLFSTFGENDRPWTLIISAIKKLKDNEDLELSSCTQNWNYLYVKDSVQQIYLLCLHALNDCKFSADVFHIASKDTRALKSFIEEMKLVLGSSSKLLYGEIKPKHQVTLNPSVEKTEQTIRFISNYTFAESIKIIKSKI